MVVGAKADERAKTARTPGQADHQGHEPRGHAQFDDQHAIQRADQQHHGDAHGYLEQRRAAADGSAAARRSPRRQTQKFAATRIHLLTSFSLRRVIFHELHGLRV